MLGIEGIDLMRVNENNLALLYLLQELSPDVRLDIANFLWLRAGMPLREDFGQRNEDYYAAPLHQLDFDDPSAAAQIKRWVYKRTGGLIEDFVEVPTDTGRSRRTGRFETREKGHGHDRRTSALPDRRGGSTKDQPDSFLEDAKMLAVRLHVCPTSKPYGSPGVEPVGLNMGENGE